MRLYALHASGQCIQWAATTDFPFRAALNGQAPLGAVFYFSSPAAGELTIPLGNATLQGSPMQPYSQFLAASQSKIFTCAPAMLISRCIPQLHAPCCRELQQLRQRQPYISSSAIYRNLK